MELKSNEIISKKSLCPKIFLSEDTIFWDDINIDTDLLYRKKLFKTLSLLESSKAGIPILPTFVPLNYNLESIKKIILLWNLPLIIRVDFSKKPPSKVLGGFPLYTEDIVKKVSSFLFNEHYYPLFHPFVDRFKNIYSVGILINPNQKTAYIEIVGKDFDAGDLRLGSSSPHEVFFLENFMSTTAKRILKISPSDYNQEKLYRERKIQMMYEYIVFINKNGRLLSSLKSFVQQNLTNDQIQINIPNKYKPISKNLLNDLYEIINLLVSKVLKKLPSSKEFVASLSYLEEHGWILWDIYGEWYDR